MNNIPVKTVLAVVLLSGCSGDGVSKSKMIDALNSDAKSAICVSTQSVMGVLLVGQKNGKQYLIARYNRPNQGSLLSVLVQKGYVDTKPTQIRYLYQTHYAHELTSKGREYFIWGKPTCLGNRVATSVTEYTEPSTAAGMTITRVSYKYDLKLNDLGNDLNLKEILQKQKNLNGQGQAVFVKTNKGWRLEGGW